jgi:hypothetical protein
MIENNRTIVKDNGNIFVNNNNIYFIIKNEVNQEILKEFVEEKFKGTIKQIIFNDKEIVNKILVITKKDINLFKKFYKIDNDAVTSLNDNYYLKILITINKVNSYINTGIKINNLNLSLSVKIKYLLEIVDYLKIEEFTIYHIIDSLLFIKSNKGIVFIAGMEC